MAGDNKAWSMMKKYQIQDVDLLVDLYEKLKPWIPSHPNVNLYNQTSGCIVCGSKHIQSRGKSVTNTTVYQRFQCQDCGKWQRGSKSEATSDKRAI
jgi:hypothetical protein